MSAELLQQIMCNVYKEAEHADCISNEYKEIYVGQDWACLLQVCMLLWSVSLLWPVWRAALPGVVPLLRGTKPPQQ